MQRGVEHARKAPPRDGSQPSRQTIRSRIRYHYTGNAEGSTLRLTLGSLLGSELGLALRRVGSGRRMTSTYEGESLLSAWMANTLASPGRSHRPPRSWKRS
jgi:hypothetical protein